MIFFELEEIAVKKESVVDHLITNWKQVELWLIGVELLRKGNESGA